ncbi:MAG: hypothetical protein ACOYIP_06810 [Coriobacteriales bacterium]
MPAVQVRDFPQEIYDRIKEEARLNGRSVTQQTKYIVIEHFAQIDEEREMTVMKEQALRGWSYKGPSSEPSPHANPFRPEDPAVIEERRARREALFKRIESRKYPDSFYEVDDVQLVREMRDER